MAVRDFRELRELELAMAKPGPTHQVLLSSITSTKLRKVIFLMWNMFGWEKFAEGAAAIDKELCGLADRLRAAGRCHTLEVELRFRGARHYPEEYDFIEFLPEFREKGVVTVINCNRVLLYSTHGH